MSVQEEIIKAWFNLVPRTFTPPPSQGKGPGNEVELGYTPHWSKQPRSQGLSSYRLDEERPVSLRPRGKMRDPGNDVVVKRVNAVF